MGEEVGQGVWFTPESPLEVFIPNYVLYSFSQYLLSPNYVPGTILSSGGVSVKKKKKLTKIFPCGTYLSARDE